jgi:formylglycine-generating enzyme required for sulfatase activity
MKAMVKEFGAGVVALLTVAMSGCSTSNRNSSPAVVNTGNALYMVIDLSGGTNATVYPVGYLSEVPEGGWTDEHRTTKLVLRLIPRGTFTMGSPPSELGHAIDEVQREVTLTSDYYMGIFEVTQRQWALVMGTWPSCFTNTTCRDSHPVAQVSYYEIRENPLPVMDQSSKGGAIAPNWPQSAQAHSGSFVGKLRAKTGVSALDLPTEAQWERTCRAGTTTALNNGKDLTSTTNCQNLSQLGHYWGDTDAITTAMVGSYLPNAWGLYDMHGNVLEYCLDWYSAQPPGTTDPVGALWSTCRVMRGGSWGSEAMSCRSASRSRMRQHNGYFHTGLRIACSINSPYSPSRTESDNALKTALLAKARLLVDARDGTNHVRIVELIQAETLKKALPGCTAFRVIKYFPNAQHRQDYPYTLVFDADTPLFIENDGSAADLLTQKRRPVRNAVQVRERVAAFADLRSISLHEHMLDNKRARSITKSSDWEFSILKVGQGWEVTCVFLTDDSIMSYDQFQFLIHEDGRMEIESCRYLFSLGGYY